MFDLIIIELTKEMPLYSLDGINCAVVFLFIRARTESSFGSGLSNRGEQHPCWQGDSKGNSVLLCLGCSEGIEFPFDRKNPKKPAVSWHTTFPGKSSVLYLCSRLTSERGWLRHLLCGQITAGRHSPGAVGQADFVRARTKCGFAHRAKFDWPEKGAKVYTKPSSRRSVPL